MDMFVDVKKKIKINNTDLATALNKHFFKSRHLAESTA